MDVVTHLVLPGMPPRSDWIVNAAGELWTANKAGLAEFDSLVESGPAYGYAGALSRPLDRSYSSSLSDVASYQAGLSNSKSLPRSLRVPYGSRTGMSSRFSTARKRNKYRRAGFTVRRRKGAPKVPRPGKRMVKAAGSNRPSPSKCLTMNGFFPECMAVSFEANATYYQGMSGGSSTTTPMYCNNDLRLYPLNYGTASSTVVGAIGMNSVPSSITQEAIGFNRLVGTTSPALYKRCCCYKVKLAVVCTVRKISATHLAVGQIPAIFSHLMHPAHTNDVLLPDPTTIGAWDQAVVQPDVRHKLGVSTSQIIQVPGTAAAAELYPISVPTPPCKWRATYWLHELQDKPFEPYLEDPNNWGTSAAEPAIGSIVQFQVQQTNAQIENYTAADYFCQFQIRATYFCLLKDKNSVGL